MCLEYLITDFHNFLLYDIQMPMQNNFSFKREELKGQSCRWIGHMDMYNIIFFVNCPYILENGYGNRRRKFSYKNSGSMDFIAVLSEFTSFFVIKTKHIGFHT